MSERAGAVALLGRNAAQLFFCFVGSALLNVVSQAHFARAAPDAKDAWLSATLLLGTIGSIAGGSAARRVGFDRRPLAAGLALLAAAVALFGGLLVLASPAAFFAGSVMLRFLLQYGTQELDERAVTLAGVADRRANDLVGLGLRFGGMLVGPLWFGLVHDAPAATAAVVLAQAALAGWTAAAVASAEPPAKPASAAPRATLDPADGALLAGARLIYAAYYLLASSIIYVLADIHHAPAATRTGGVLVTIVYASAIAATVIEMARRRAGRRSPLEMLPAAALMILVGGALYTPVAAWAPALFTGGALLGVAFARFQLAFRDHATHAAVHRDRPELLAAYNNLANTSALVGYGMMAAQVAICRALGVSSARGVGAGVALLGAAAAPVVIAGVRRGER